MSYVEDAISTQVLEDGFKGGKNPLDAVEDLFDMEDLTEDEAQMIRDWESRLLDLTPVLRIEEWTRTQRFLRKLLSQRESRGEDLIFFSQTTSHIDQTGQLVSGRLNIKCWNIKHLIFGRPCKYPLPKIVIYSVSIALELKSI